MSAKVVTRGLDTDCATGWCPKACSHLEIRCEPCSTEWGWGGPRVDLELYAAEHNIAHHPETIPEPRDS